MKNGDDFTIPLCRKHHDELHAFGDEALFFALRGVDPVLILAQMKGEYNVQSEGESED
jgi:hypothetical protein